MNHEKEIYEMCIDKVKESMKLLNEVDQIVRTCGTCEFPMWHIHGWANFKQVCGALNLSRYKCVRDWGGYSKMFFEYAGVHVFVLVHPADDVYAEVVLNADEVS